MNQYSELLYYIKSLADADAFVNTVTQVSEDEIDIDKANIFPLLNIDILGDSFSNGQTILLSVELICFSQRDSNKEVRTDKFWMQDNEVDNYNETLAVLNRIWLEMYKNLDDNNITSSPNPSLEKLRAVGTNVLDGWKLSFTVEIPNTTIALC